MTEVRHNDHASAVFGVTVQRKALIATLAAAAVVLALGAPAAGAAYDIEPDLSYDSGTPAADPAQKRLDPYLPRDFGGTRPVVVWVHGGGWRRGDKANGIADKARLLTGLGYVLASVNYRLSPDPPDSADPGRVRFPSHPRDVAEAIGWLERNAGSRGGDPDRFLLAGHSAGAQIVSLLGADRRLLRERGVGRRQIAGVVAPDTAAFDIARREPGLEPEPRIAGAVLERLRHPGRERGRRELARGLRAPARRPGRSAAASGHPGGERSPAGGERRDGGRARSGSRRERCRRRCRPRGDQRRPRRPR